MTLRKLLILNCLTYILFLHLLRMSLNASSVYCRCYSSSYSPSNSLDWFKADHTFYIHTQGKMYIQNVIFSPPLLGSCASKNYCCSPSTRQKFTQSVQIHLLIAAQRRCTLPPEGSYHSSTLVLLGAFCCRHDDLDAIHYSNQNMSVFLGADFVVVVPWYKLYVCFMAQFC